MSEHACRTSLRLLGMSPSTQGLRPIRLDCRLIGGPTEGTLIVCLDQFLSPNAITRYSNATEASFCGVCLLSGRLPARLKENCLSLALGLAEGMVPWRSTLGTATFNFPNWQRKIYLRFRIGVQPCRMP
jgi:hypothetical protein